jgi:hypothetical protein
MANTRSGGAPGDSSASISSRRETRSSSAATTTNLRRSTRETKGKKKSDLALATTPTPSQRSTRPSAKKPQGDSTPSTRKPTRVKANTASPAPDNTTAKRKKDNHNDPQSADNPSKKQKRLMHPKSYIALFKGPEQQVKSPPGMSLRSCNVKLVTLLLLHLLKLTHIMQNTPFLLSFQDATYFHANGSMGCIPGRLLYHFSIYLAGDNAFFSVFIIYCPNAVFCICIFFVLVFSSPHRDDGEDASKVQVEDNDAGLVGVQNDAHEQVNQEPFDLHETPEAILERDELKIRCLQSEIVSEVGLPFLKKGGSTVSASVLCFRC